MTSEARKMIRKQGDLLRQLIVDVHQERVDASEMDVFEIVSKGWRGLNHLRTSAVIHVRRGAALDNTFGMSGQWIRK